MPDMMERLRNGERLKIAGHNNITYTIWYQGALYWLQIGDNEPVPFTLLMELVGLLVGDFLGAWEPGSEASHA